MTLLAYHGKQEIKDKYVAAMADDIKAERLQPGHYWDGKTGCFVGCVIRGDDHSKFESAIGFPQMLAMLGDAIYEGLPTRTSKQWFALKFLKVVKPGADLSRVSFQLMHWNLAENLVLRDSDDAAVQEVIVQCRAAIKQCAEAIYPLTVGEEFDKNAVRMAANAARAAWWKAGSAVENAVSAVENAVSAAERAVSAAESAVSAAESAVSAAESAEASAESAVNAAESAEASAEASAARSAAYEKMADKLIELLKAAI